MTDECRELVFKGNLKRRGGTAGDSGDIQVFLFDHALLMVKQKEKNKSDQHKVYRRVRDSFICIFPRPSFMMLHSRFLSSSFSCLYRKT